MSDDAHFPSTTDRLDEVGGRALVEAWRSSGLSGAAFCRDRDLRPQRLHYWRERLGYPIKVVRDARSASVARPPTTGGFVQMVIRDPVSPSITYVDILVGGATIRVGPGCDMDLMRDVVTALSERPSGC